MLTWLRRSTSGSTGGMSAMLGALDEVFNPGAARADELLQEQHERVLPRPSPGDRLLSEGKVVITPPKPDERNRG